MNKKSVIVIPDNPRLRGRPYYIAQTMQEKGYDAYYIMWDTPYNFRGKELFKHFFTSLITSEYPSENITVHKIARLPYYWPYINGILFKIQIKKLYKKINAEIIITESYTNETEVPKSLPFIYDIADEYSATADLYGSIIYKLAFRLLDIKGTMKRQSKNALAVTALSDDLVEFASKYNNLVVKLPSGIEREPIEKILNDHSIYSSNRYSMIYVSGFGQWSRPIETMQTVIELKKEFPLIDLTMIGPGSEVEKIKKFIKDNKVENYIHYLGPIFDRKKVFTHIKRSAIGLNISDKNKFRDAAHPVKVLEYSAFGKKVISTNLDEVEALNLPNVFIFNDYPEGPDIKTVMRATLLYKEKKDEYIKTAKEVFKKYNWDTLTDNLINLIDQVRQK